MKWFVSRQHYWGVPEEEAHVVEIAEGGLDYANPDMLVERYGDEGEGAEYGDPREAVKVALAIAEAWRKDEPDTIIHVASGCTGGYTMPFEPKEVEELTAWAEEKYAELPKCDRCGELIEEGGGWRNPNSDWTGFQYCRQYCAEMDCVEEEEGN